MKANATLKSGIMSQMTIWGCSLLGIVMYGVLALRGNSAVAQIVPDRTLPNNSTVTVNGSIFNITGGTTAGRNLFQSFQQFSVPTGGTASFNNGLDIQNIFSRVTGGSLSNINGLIKANGTANLFLINPNGIIFGPSARLDIGGSFSATTASSLKFSNGSTFSATNPQAPPLLTVNITPGLQYGASQPGATITNTGNLAPQQDLTLVADKLDLQGQLKAGRDLTLLAQDTVKVRDSVATPFLATAGGNFTLRGNQGIDILALNHPTQTPFVSGGNLSLISDGIISLDARFASGGSFLLKSGSGGLANLVSKYDPIISSNGDVDVAANYTGASLLVESKGNIRFGGDINITTPDTSVPAGQDTATLSQSTALIMRSGQSNLAYGGVNSGSIPVYGNGTVPQGITIGKNVTLQPFNGSGGIVSLSAGSGNVITQEITTNAGAIAVLANGNINLGNLNAANFGDGSGGNITLRSNNGSVTTGNLDTGANNNAGAISVTGQGDLSINGYIHAQSNTNGSGGNITLRSNNGSVTTGNFDTGANNNAGAISVTGQGDLSINGYIHAQSNTNGNGNSVTLTSTNGAIYTTTRETLDTSSKSGNGGAIALTANGNITTGGMNSEAGGTGNGGDITLTSIAGGIDTTSGTITSQIHNDSGGTGNGGAIVFTAKGDIRTAKLDASAESGKGALIQLTSIEGAIDTTRETLYTDSRSGNTGKILLKAFNNITTGNINSNINSSNPLDRGGDINLISENGEVRLNGDITNYTDGASPAGDINIKGQSIFINPVRLSASTFGQGDAGNVNMNARDTVKFNGGTVFSTIESGATANGGNITIKTGSLFLTNGVQLQTLVRGPMDKKPAGKGIAGNVNIDAREISIDGQNSAVFSDLEAEAVGDAGKINISTGSLKVTNGARLESSTSGHGNAGDVTINARDTVSFNKGSVFSNVSGVGNGGNITINAPSLNLINDSSLRAAVDAGGNGEAGNVHIKVTGSILMDGEVGSGIPAIISYIRPGDTNTIGKGGNITIEAGSLSLNRGAEIGAGVGDNIGGIATGNGGKILIQVADGLSLNQSFIASQVFSNGIGNAGDIEIHAGSVDLNKSVISTTTAGQGNAGKISLQARSLFLTDGTQLNAVTSGQGNAGDIVINTTDKVSVSGTNTMFTPTNFFYTLKPLFTTAPSFVDGVSSGLTVSSTGGGSAGNLTVSAGSLHLDNGAKISADTRGGGGNISLNLPLLLLRRGSSITTNASGNNITGGNITIDAKNGFIVAVPSENSDISANSSDFRGGNVKIINATGIFGTQFRNAPTPLSDITATGKDSSLNGTVQINTPDIDPSRGLVQLPTVVVNTPKLISSACAAASDNSFTITGRGGLPPSPSEPLSSDVVWTDARLPVTTTQHSSNKPKAKPHSKPKAEPIAIVPATGWVFNKDKGEVTLISSAPSATGLESNPATCSTR